MILKLIRKNPKHHIDNYIITDTAWKVKRNPGKTAAVLGKIPLDEGGGS
jgi:hypothetical protein